MYSDVTQIILAANQLSKMRETIFIAAGAPQVMWLVVAEVWSKSSGLAGYRVPSLQRMTYLCVLSQALFSSSSVVSHAFSAHVHAMRVFDVRASSSPPGYPCAKFCVCHAPHCWASPWRKIAYSFTPSLSSPGIKIKHSYLPTGILRNFIPSPQDSCNTHKILQGSRAPHPHPGLC